MRPIHDNIVNTILDLTDRDIEMIRSSVKMNLEQHRRILTDEAIFSLESIIKTMDEIETNRGGIYDK